MRPQLEFLFFEIKRHVPTLLFGTTLLLVMPVCRGLIEDDWRYWDGDWNVWGGMVALLLIAPLLILSMTASGWSHERETKTLGWLYSRPLSSAVIFGSRVFAICLCLGAWIALALLTSNASLDGYANALGVLPGFPERPNTVPQIAAFLAMVLGAGLLTSAICSSTASALRASILIVLATLLSASVVPSLTTHRELFAGTDISTGFSGATVAGGVFAYSMLFLHAGLALSALFGAWAAVRRAPADRLRLRAAARFAMPCAGLVMVAYIGLLHIPLTIDTRKSYSIATTGDGQSFGLYQATGTFLYHPIVFKGTGDQVLRQRFSWGELSANPRHSTVIIRSFPDGWILVDGNGRARDLAVQADMSLGAVGWSPDGNYFAWHGPGRILLLREDLEVLDVHLPVQSAKTRLSAVWIDNDKLLVTGSLSVRTRDENTWWLTLNVDGQIEVGPLTLEEEMVLDWPARSYYYLDPPAAAGLPRLQDHSVLLLRTTERPPIVHLVRLSPDHQGFETVRELRAELIPTSLGNLTDDSLVWAEVDTDTTNRLFNPIGSRPVGRETSKIMRLASITQEPTEVCTVPTRLLTRFLGQKNHWALWQESFRDWAWACNFESGEVKKVEDLPILHHDIRSIQASPAWARIE